MPFASPTLRDKARVKIRITVSPDIFFISKEYNIEYRLDEMNIEDVKSAPKKILNLLQFRPYFIKENIPQICNRGWR